MSLEVIWEKWVWFSSCPWQKGVGQQEEDKEEVEEGEDERGVADTKPSESGEGDGGSWEYVVHYAMAPSYFSVRILEKVSSHN